MLVPLLISFLLLLLRLLLARRQLKNHPCRFCWKNQEPFVEILCLHPKQNLKNTTEIPREDAREGTESPSGPSAVFGSLCCCLCCALLLLLLCSCCRCICCCFCCFWFFVTAAAAASCRRPLETNLCRTQLSNNCLLSVPTNRPLSLRQHGQTVRPTCPMLH